MWTNLRVILFIERCWAIWAYWAPAMPVCCGWQWALGGSALKVMLQNPQHEIANSIFNLIQRTGSQVLICTVSALAPLSGDWKPDISYSNELPRVTHFSAIISVFVRDWDAGVGDVVCLSVLVWNIFVYFMMTVLVLLCHQIWRVMIMLACRCIIKSVNIFSSICDGFWSVNMNNMCYCVPHCSDSNNTKYVFILTSCCFNLSQSDN